MFEVIVHFNGTESPTCSKCFYTLERAIPFLYEKLFDRETARVEVINRSSK